MLSPDYYYDSVHDVPYTDLWARGIRAIIFDLDNTLAPYDTTRPTAKTVALIKRLRRIGFSVCLLSNNNGKRINEFNGQLGLGLTAIPNAMKPLTAGINRAINEMNAQKEHTAIIGDQLFSDVWAGRNAGLTTILVKPLGNDIAAVRWKRIPERWFLNAYLKKAKSQNK
jgi:HAD superfamily phosphatase (TIGR01668 family)